VRYWTYYSNSSRHPAAGLENARPGRAGHIAAPADREERARVIVLTASDDKNEFVQAMKLGTSGIVLKQTATELLIKSIRKSMRRDLVGLPHHGRRDSPVCGQRRGSAAAHHVRRGAARPGAFAAQPAGTRDRGAGGAGFQKQRNGEKMFISEQTVKNHLHNIFDKLGVSDRLELALYAIHNNLHTGR